jgi:serine/threonine protein kinase
MSQLKSFVPFNEHIAKPLHTHFPYATPNSVDLLRKLLTFDPNRRISASEASEFVTLAGLCKCSFVIVCSGIRVRVYIYIFSQ